MVKKPFGRWTRRRHLSQAVVMLLFFLLPLPIPFIPGLEEGLLKVDFNQWRVHYFGLVLVPGNLIFISLGIILLLFAVLLMSSLYGKVFCGWMCPQNFFYENFEAVHGYLRKRYPYYRHRPRLQKGVDLAMALVAAGAVTYGVNAYFVGASPLFTAFVSLFFFTFVTVDTHLLKHQFCKQACPYAFLQQSFHDDTALHVVWENRPGNKCGVCQACVKACYVDLDIKKDTFHIDCTQCGACVDACDRVFSRSPEPSLLQFAFDPKKKSGFLGIDSWRKGFIVCSFVIYCAFFAWMVYRMPSMQFRVDYPSGGSTLAQRPYYENGAPANDYIVRVRNLSRTPFILRLEAPSHFQITLHERTDGRLEGLQHTALPITIRWEQPTPGSKTIPIKVNLRDAEGTLRGEQEVLFRLP